MKTLSGKFLLISILVVVFPFAATASVSAKSFLPNSVGLELGGDIVLDGSLSFGWHNLASAKHMGQLYAGVRISPTPGVWKDTNCPLFTTCDPTEYNKVLPDIHWGLFAGIENDPSRRIRTRFEVRASMISGRWQHVYVDYMGPGGYVADYVAETGTGTLYTMGVVGSVGVRLYSGLDFYIMLGMADVMATSDGISEIDKNARLRGAVGLRFTRIQ